MKKKSVLGGIAGGYFLLAAVMYGWGAIRAALFNASKLEVRQDGFALYEIEPTDFLEHGQWLLLLPALLAVAAGVLTLVTALKSVRWCGIAATAGAVGAMISWLLISPQSLMMSTHLTYRSFFGLNLVPLVENLPFLFPLYRLVFLAGCGLAIFAIGGPYGDICAGFSLTGTEFIAGFLRLLFSFSASKSRINKSVTPTQSE